MPLKRVAQRCDQCGELGIKKILVFPSIFLTFRGRPRCQTPEPKAPNVDSYYMLSPPSCYAGLRGTNISFATVNTWGALQIKTLTLERRLDCIVIFQLKKNSIRQNNVVLCLKKVCRDQSFCPPSLGGLFLFTCRAFMRLLHCVSTLSIEIEIFLWL